MAVSAAAAVRAAAALGAHSRSSSTGSVRKIALGAVAECTIMMPSPCPYRRYLRAVASTRPVSQDRSSPADAGMCGAASAAGQPATAPSRPSRSRMPPD